MCITQLYFTCACPITDDDAINASAKGAGKYQGRSKPVLVLCNHHDTTLTDRFRVHENTIWAGMKSAPASLFHIMMHNFMIIGGALVLGFNNLLKGASSPSKKPLCCFCFESTSLLRRHLFVQQNILKLYLSVIRESPEQNTVLYWSFEALNKINCMNTEWIGPHS